MSSQYAGEVVRSAYRTRYPDDLERGDSAGGPLCRSVILPVATLGQSIPPKQQHRTYEMGSGLILAMSGNRAVGLFRDRAKLRVSFKQEGWHVHRPTVQKRLDL